MAIPAVIFAIGLLLLVLPVRRSPAPQAPPAPPVPEVPLAIDPADWEATCNETPDHSLVFLLRHRVDNPGAILAFSVFRCIVTDSGGVTTTATGTQLFYQYHPAFFPGRPPVRSGLYRFAWEGLDDKGAWRRITEGEYEVKLPNLIVTIMEDSKFENWKRIVLIAALHVQVENTTDTDILVAGYSFTYDNEGRPLWYEQASADDNRSVEQEFQRRKERQEPGQPLPNYMRIPAHARVSGWLVTGVTLRPKGGTPECTVIVRDDTGNTYQATLPRREPQTYGS